MNLFGNLIGKLGFSWHHNRKKSVAQERAEMQVYQEKGGVTNVVNIQAFTINNIRELAQADTLENPKALLNSATKRFIVEQAFKQANLKAAVEKAELQEISNPHEIDKDWFLKWMEVAQGVSRENVQEILARILSDEVTSTGTFSARTLEILKNLTRRELQLFQKFCDISCQIPAGDQVALVMVISEPFGNPGNNGLEPVGLSYPNLKELEDAGLIQGDLTAYQELPVSAVFQAPFLLGSKTLALKPTQEAIQGQVKVKILIFTRSGRELRSVLLLGENGLYIQKFLEWAEQKWKMVPKDQL